MLHIQHHPTTKNNDSRQIFKTFCFIKAEINKCLIQHRLVCSLAKALEGEEKLMLKMMEGKDDDKGEMIN